MKISFELGPKAAAVLAAKAAKLKTDPSTLAARLVLRALRPGEELAGLILKGASVGLGAAFGQAVKTSPQLASALAGAARPCRTLIADEGMAQCALPAGHRGRHVPGRSR